MSKTKWILVALLAVIALGAGATFFFFPGNASRQAGGAANAAMAPDFALPAVRGEGTISLSEYKGNVVLVNFWATWCPPCKEEIPAFNQVRNSLHDQGFEILGISLDEGGPGVVVPFAQEYAISYPLMMGNQAVTQSYGGIRGIPTSFLVDREGRIVEKYIGPIDAQTLTEAVRAIL